MSIQKYHTIIIGSGAAGLNCAYQLVKNGIDPSQIAIITDKVGGGTSFNTGSDKQTYYKMSMIGDAKDSPLSMAQSLFNGGSMHGDVALVECTGSIQAFMNLVSLGVPFPHNKYGAFLGYKTDNDPFQRGTSIGPLTSQTMGQCLLKAVKRENIHIFDNHHVLKILTTKEPKKSACGIIALDLNGDNSNSTDLKSHLKVCQSEFVVLATGGPSGMYLNSVYPTQHWGATSLAIEAGATLQNLTESQYGLASTKYRWNVSGTYQQVIPRYISVGKDEDPMDPNVKPKEFLQEYFPSLSTLITATFLKGYQWPFNAERIEDHKSSLVDMAVHIETVVNKRKVYMDFLNNPNGFKFDKLEGEAKEYLENSKALQDTPIERLNHMNPKAIKLYQDNGIDLWKEPLEVAVCAQHCNGGVTGDIWYESTISRLFSVGEVNGSHGIHRPGGAALNSGQVSSTRAAQKIAFGKWKPLSSTDDSNDFDIISEVGKTKLLESFGQLLSNTEGINANEKLKPIQQRMMKYGAYIRKEEELSALIKSTKEEFRNFFSLGPESIKISNLGEVVKAWQVYEALLCEIMFLQSIKNHLAEGGGTHGSFLVIDNEGGSLLHPKLKEFKYKKDKHKLQHMIQEITCINPLCPEFSHRWVHRRPLPTEDSWFETEWARFDKKEIYND